MSPSEWSARGDSNPDLHGLSVPRLPIAPRADGDHGRTRTTTGQALDLLPLPDWATWPLVPLGGLEPRPRGLRARHAPLTLQRGVGANGGIRTRTSRLGRPAGSRYPHSQLGTGVVHRPIDIRQLSKTPLLRAGGRQGIRTQTLRLRENGVTARQRTIRTYRPMATAPGFEPGPSSFGGSDASVTPRCRCHFTSRTVSKTEPPRHLTQTSSERQAKTKKAF
jgi:hypothetical protein